jgi:hypothetical protein
MAQASSRSPAPKATRGAPAGARVLAGDDASAAGLCSVCDAPAPAWRTFGRAHAWTRDRVDLVEHLYCDAHVVTGEFEAAITGRAFERRPAEARP